MAKKHSGLGRGLSALIPDEPEVTREPGAAEDTAVPAKKTARKRTAGSAQSQTSVEDGALRTVRITMIEPDKTQPRKNFSEEELEELASSIKEHGLLQPIVVVQNKDNNRYTIVAGERRWRACRIAGLKEVEVLVRVFKDPQEQLEASLIENIQREDLNPVEEAQAYQRLIDEFGLKQDEVAAKVSRSRAAVANSLRLLKLSEGVQQMVIDGKLSMGHARALLPVEDPEQQKALADLIVAKDLSVREVEKLVKSLGRTHKHTDKAIDPSLAVAYTDIQNRMQQSLGMNVKISPKAKGSGRIEITFSNNDDLEKLMDRIFQA